MKIYHKTKYSIDDHIAVGEAQWNSAVVCSYRLLPRIRASNYTDALQVDLALLYVNHPSQVFENIDAQPSNSMLTRS